MLSKKEIRAEAKRRIGLLSPEDQARLSEEAGRRAADYLDRLHLPDGTRIGLFINIKGAEIETRPLIDRLQNTGRYRLLVPRVDDETTIRFYPYDAEAPHVISGYGIWEPLAPLSEALVPSVILVPGLAFDRNGGRVGHGKGFYDRYFATHPEEIRLRIAFAFSCQTFETVPTDPNDHPMDLLITDKETVLF